MGNKGSNTGGESSGMGRATGGDQAPVPGSGRNRQPGLNRRWQRRFHVKRAAVAQSLKKRPGEKRYRGVAQ